jgi:hypothetical protein
VTQLLYEFTGRADVPFGIAFQLFPKFCSACRIGRLLYNRQRRGCQGRAFAQCKTSQIPRLPYLSVHESSRGRCVGVIARRVRPSVRSYARGEVSLQFHPAHMAKTTWPQPCGRGLFGRLARPQRERSRLVARASFRGASHPFQQAHLLPWTVDYITKWVGTTLGRGARYLGHRCSRRSSRVSLRSRT